MQGVTGALQTLEMCPYRYTGKPLQKPEITAFKLDKLSQTGYNR